MKRIETAVLDRAEKWIKENWQTTIGVFVTSFLVTAFIGYNAKNLTLKGVFDFLLNNITNKKWLVLFFIYSLLYFVVCLVVLQLIKFPKISKNKVGIYIALDNRYKDDEAKKFLKKVYAEITAVLNNTGFGNTFQVIALDSYKTKRVLEERLYVLDPRIKKTKWKVNMDKIKWNFILFGAVKKAKVKGEDVYKIETDYAVRHATIPKHLSDNMGVEFKQFLQKQPWGFPVREELQCLEIISENIRENILFSLGVSAYVSGAIGVALIYHSKLVEIAQPRLSANSHLKTLISRTNDLMANENHILGNFYFQQGELDKAIEHQENVVALKENHYGAHLNLAHHYYLKDSSVNKLKVDFHLQKAEKYQHDSAYKLSQAFIKIERDSLYKEGIDLYDSALRKGLISTEVAQATLHFLEIRKKTNYHPYLEFIGAMITYFKIDKKEGAKLLNDFINKFKGQKEYIQFVQKSRKLLGKN